MKRALYPLIATLTVCLLPAYADVRLAPGESFPIIAMPDSRSGDLKSLADFRGEKVMLQIFASW